MEERAAYLSTDGRLLHTLERQGTLRIRRREACRAAGRQANSAARAMYHATCLGRSTSCAAENDGTGVSRARGVPLSGRARADADKARAAQLASVLERAMLAVVRMYVCRAYESSATHAVAMAARSAAGRATVGSRGGTPVLSVGRLFDDLWVEASSVPAFGTAAGSAAAAALAAADV